MRKLLQYLLKRPVTWLANKYSGSPDRKAVFRSLGNLYRKETKQHRGLLNMEADIHSSFIIFSDQHKGNGDKADDFRASEFNYTSALDHYHKNRFTFINLGDAEELWKYNAENVLPASAAALQAEAAFQQDKRFVKIFGNHDLMWKNPADANKYLEPYFEFPLNIYEAVIIHLQIRGKQLSVFLTHGHQGDRMSDNNGLSSWLVAHWWAPFQRYLGINVNTPSTDPMLRNKHNRIMYEWSSHRKNLLLITGHTHQPVFASGRYSDHHSNHISDEVSRPLKPSYFNTGCCCFSDGDITGIEIADGFIRLVKWYDELEMDDGKPWFDHRKVSKRKVLEEKRLEDLMGELD